MLINYVEDLCLENFSMLLKVVTLIFCFSGRKAILGRK